MSSKRAEHTPERRTAGSPPRVWSITGRLTVLYTASAGGMLILSALFLYWVLASNLAREEHQFLADKMHVLHGILRDHPHGFDHRVGHCGGLHMTAESMHASCLRCVGLLKRELEGPTPC